MSRIAFFLNLGFLLFAAESTNAAKALKYQGIASDEAGRILYTEDHVAEFDDQGLILSARTSYRSSDGKELASLNSEFSVSLTTPSYVFRNLVDGSENGVRHSGEGLILFNRPANKSEETKVAKSAQANSLQVGGQGLHYYLAKNLAQVQTQPEMDLDLLAPGGLDVYRFRMKVVAQDAETVQLKLEVKNFLLRFFAPSLSLKYAKGSGRLLEYHGISNLPTAQGKLQNVRIRYVY